VIVNEFSSLFNLF